MKLTFFWTLLTGCLLLIACSEKKNPLKEEVMSIHDSIMPHMGEIMSLQDTLTQELTQTDQLLLKNPADTTLMNRRKQLQELIANLKEADEAMMHWMHQYKADTLSQLDEQQAELYLQNQKQSIERVRDHMQQSIEKAQSFKP